MFKRYLLLTKPGILFGNLVTTLGGLFLAAPSLVHLHVFFATIIGTLCVVASGCVFNNIIDQDIDQKMQRTLNRAMVQKTIAVPHAAIFASILGIIGFSILYFLVNSLATLFAGVGFVVYVLIYSLWAKRHTIHQTIIGSISGACPPLIGYCAMRGTIDSGAILLFLAYAFWQMPHSWGIAIYRLDDYTAAHIPILPVARSLQRTKIESLLYVVLFTISMNGLFVLHYTNWIFLVVFNLMALYWIYLSVQGLNATDDQAWAKRYFMYSVKLITLISLSFLWTRTASFPVFSWS